MGDHNSLNLLVIFSGQFFRCQVDEAVKQFQDKMHSILEEQQIHVRQITAKALKGSEQQVS